MPQLMVLDANVTRGINGRGMKGWMTKAHFNLVLYNDSSESSAKVARAFIGTPIEFEVEQPRFGAKGLVTMWYPRKEMAQEAEERVRKLNPACKCGKMLVVTEVPTLVFYQEGLLPSSESNMSLRVDVVHCRQCNPNPQIRAVVTAVEPKP